MSHSSTGGPTGLTVGSLLGLPTGSVGRQTTPPPAAVASASASDAEAAVPNAMGEQEGPGWTVFGGEADTGQGASQFRADGVEVLTYNNTFGQIMERVWFDGKIVFALDLGAVDVDADRVTVAQEYQVVYEVELDERGKLRAPPQLVPGQLNIYDSVPGMRQYSPIWQFNYVLVPRDFEPNSLRSERDCLESGHRILRSQQFEN